MMYGLLATIFAATVLPGKTAVTIGAHAPEDQLKALRRTIFVEKQYIRAPTTRKCTSIGGPSCFFLNGDDDEHAVLDGVIPARLFPDRTGQQSDEMQSGLGGGNGERSYQDFPGHVQVHALSFDDFERFWPLSKTRNTTNDTEGTAHEDAQKAGSRMREHNASVEEAGRNDIVTLHPPETGLMHFNMAGLKQGTRISPHFSRGLPSPMVASWEGSWVIRARDAATTSYGSLTLSATDDQIVPALARNDNVAIETSVEIQSAVGYIRFSRPVVVRSVMVKWTPPLEQNKNKKSKVSTPPAIIAGRLGLSRAWSTHLDPKQAAGQWINGVGGTLSAIDEIVFIAAVGLEIGLLEVAVQDASTELEGRRDVLVLAPAPANNDPSSQWTIRTESLSLASLPFVMSLQDVVDRKLQLVAPAESLHADSGATAGLVSSSEAATHMLAASAGLMWQQQVAENDMLLDHDGLAPMLKGSGQKSLLATPGDGDDDDDADDEESRIEIVLKDAVRKYVYMPDDLRRTIKRRRSDILAAAKAWVHNGARWRAQMQSVRVRDSSEDVVKRYSRAKACEADLDLYTAALLYYEEKQNRKNEKERKEIHAAAPVAGISGLAGIFMNAKSLAQLMESVGSA